MSSKKICAANWKLHKNPKETLQYLEEFSKLAKDNSVGEVIFFPPASSWQTFSENSPFSWGAQNVHWELQGAFTGENSAKVLKDLGASSCLVGHSERRQIFNETKEVLIKKIHCLLEVGIIPLLCVGETLEERESGRMNAIIEEQVLSVLKSFKAPQEIWIAYEPVWAIGTGKVATPQQANEAHLFVRGLLEKSWGSESSKNTPILYGGSVKPENAEELLEQPEVDGFLVGGASLKCNEFISICSIAQKHS
ncbi:MAG: triose-phosphate isomerase [Bdellovibrionales bacterium]|nr:triose-phosphate isomerase [Bdellovibrionales bacterium]